MLCLVFKKKRSTHDAVLNKPANDEQLYHMKNILNYAKFFKPFVIVISPDYHGLS